MIKQSSLLMSLFFIACTTNKPYVLIEIKVPTIQCEMCEHNIESALSDLDGVKKMKEDAIILHPLPRIDEISTDVDSSKQAKYFEQAEYGKYTRAALLGLILNENGF